MGERIRGLVEIENPLFSLLDAQKLQNMRRMV